MNNSIAAIILTYNEEKHISRCINSLKNICEEYSSSILSARTEL